MNRVGLLIPSDVMVEEKKEIRCPHCGKTYKSDKSLEIHCRKEHPDAFHE